MKRHNDLYQKIYSFDNLHQAYLEARKGKRYRDEVLEFSANLEENLIIIQNELIWKTYKVGSYREFYVYEPKKRLIMALPFKDRVVQWAIYQVLNPLLERRFILDSYACRVGFGAHRAVDRLQYWLRKLKRQHDKIYILKMDISKYFYRVDHEVLLIILTNIIKDQDLLWLLGTILKSNDHPFGLSLDTGGRLNDIGMPIGNLTSQMFANLYLNELDQFVKHQLRSKYYMRYMDDSLVLHWDKAHLWHVKQEIERFLDERLHLRLNNKTTIRAVNQGVDWVGYRVWPTHVKLRKSTAHKMKVRLKYLQKAYTRWEVDFEEVNASIQSYLGLLAHCDSYNLQKKLLEALVFVRR